MRFLPLAGSFIALATPFILFTKREPGWFSASEAVAALLFLPVSVASIVVIIISLFSGALKRPFGAMTASLCLALIFPFSLGWRYISGSISKKSYLEEQGRREAWHHYDVILIPGIVEYVLAHPEKISHPYGDDRALIAGLGDHLRSTGTTVPTNGNDIIDPWGNPIWIIMDHDGDMQLKFEDEFYGVWAEKGNKLVVALATRQLYSLDDSASEQWQLEGGRLENP